jgi:hypothetical protein
MRKSSLIAASVLLFGSALNAQAQSAFTDRSLMFDPNGLSRIPAVAAPQPTAHPPDTRRQPRNPTLQPAPAPTRNTTQRTIEKDTPDIAQPSIGRIPFETGTIGLTTSRHYSNSAFADGRVTPGFENVQAKSPSYFGLSLSVPTDKQTLLPLPLFSRPD